MAHIKAVWGPHKTTIGKDCVKWSFTGVRTNGTFARWTLTFYFDSRKFRTRALYSQPTDPDPGTDWIMMPELQRSRDVTGPVTPMLIAKLKPEHIAAAARGAIEYRGRK